MLYTRHTCPSKGNIMHENIPKEKHSASSFMHIFMKI